jgi:demethylmenaquinone methyltransferase / 2-methoxy-6-polyprenyl-1,4-benzoquinol methylase
MQLRENAVRGTKPPGAESEREASRQIRDMFSGIAPRYDLLNHILSMRMDGMWRRRVARKFRDILEREDARVLDLCCGTGDLAFALGAVAKAKIFGSDFAHPMLVRAREKAKRNQRGLGGNRGDSVQHKNGFEFVEADALALPFQDRSFDLITTAFGFRNLANYENGLREILRVLRPGGEVGILEFCEPTGKFFGPVYRFYFHNVIPKLGSAISGSTTAYTYLPKSVEIFPDPEALAALMSTVGFGDVRFEAWTFGALALHAGRRV